MKYTTLIAIQIALLLSACGMSPSSSPIAGTDTPGYQFGDLTGGAVGALKAQQQDYCATANPLLRAGLLIAIRSRVPDYPPSGLCTDADKPLAQAIARRLAELPEGAVVTLEQAREDQRRFQALDATDPETEGDDL